MVLYNPEALISFSRYGIGIPSLDSRKSNTIKALLENPLLGGLAGEWYRSEIPSLISREDLERAHTPEYINGLYGSQLEEKLMQAYELIDDQGQYHRYRPDTAETPLSGLLEDVLRIISGSYLNIKQALTEGFSYYLGGGMHHAHPGFGHGFCLLNDICIALLKAQSEGLFQTAWVVDVDAHRGDGTAEILSDQDSITSLSIHMAEGWPLDTPEFNEEGIRNPGWFPGDVDIPVSPGEEDSYVPRLIGALKDLAEKGLPDLVFVVGGVDPYEKDELASSAPIRMTKAQMLERDSALYDFFDSRKVPQAWVAAGGYGAFSWEIHTQFLQQTLLKRLN